MIYVICFVFSTVLMRQAVKARNTRVAAIYLVLSGLILVLLAALRGMDVGTDVRVYQLPYFNAARSSSSFYIFTRRVSNRYEIVYLLITYIISRTNSIRLLFFVNELIIVFFVYKSIWLLRHVLFAEIMLQVFLVFYYLRGYNSVRQSMAMAVILYATCQMLQNRYKLMMMLFLVALGCHFSAIIAVVIFLLYKLSLSRYSLIYQAAVLAALFVTCFTYREMMLLAARHLSFIPRYYLMKESLSREATNLPILNMLFALLCLTITVINVRNNNKSMLLKKTHTPDEILGYAVGSRFMIYIMLASLIGNIVAAQSVSGGRVFEYFSFYNILSFPMVYRLFQPKYNRYIYLLFSGLFLMYFYVMYVLNGANEVYPYVFLE